MRPKRFVRTVRAFGADRVRRRDRGVMRLRLPPERERGGDGFGAGRFGGALRGRPRTVWPLALLAPTLALSAAPAKGQEVVADSLVQQMRQRLERLARPLGDSSGLAVADSSEQAVRGGVRFREPRQQGDRTSAGADSLLQALLALPGYDVVQYQGTAVSFDARSRILTLLGTPESEARLIRSDMELAGDSALVFNEETGRLVTVGREAMYRPQQGDQVQVRRLVFDLNEERGTATGARTKTSAGAGEWIVQGDFDWVSRDVSYGHDIFFTTCEEEDPHYHFVARALKLVPGGTLVARNVLLYFADVPVFWVPFLAQSTQQGRRSGLLPVRFSVNDIVRTSGSYSRRLSNLGFYWAMSDYADAEAALDWWSGNYFAAKGGLRYRWLRRFLEGRANFQQFWRNEGGSELAVDTSHQWEISERMQMRASFRYASSADFVRRNSFDPRQVTQSIDSDGGLNRRFDWGSLSLSFNRRQFLSDDRVEMTLPTANLSLSTITLLREPSPTRARFYNNMTLSASGSFSRSIRDLPAPGPDESFSLAAADGRTLQGAFSTTLSMGALSVAQNASLRRNTALDVPQGFFEMGGPASPAGVGSVADLERPVFAAVAPAPAASDFSADELTWATRINYQQNLVGSTTLTPQLAISGRSIRSDTSSAGSGFTAAPTRISLGVQLKSDIYGFYADGNVRHKLSPTFDYSYSPETQPTPLQEAVFGSRAIQPRNQIVIGLNQTFEARRGGDDADSTSAGAGTARSDGPRRAERSEKVTLLAWRTSAVTYDFEQASRLGHFTRGFADNLRVANQFSSDYLRGLAVSTELDVFDDSGAGAEGGRRSFSPFLSSVNLSFSLSSRSTLFRWLRGLRGAEEEEDAGEPEAAEEPLDAEDQADDPEGLTELDRGDPAVVPGFGTERDAFANRGPAAGGVGQWNASVSYSLARSRHAATAPSQMLQAALRFQPTPKWSVNWRTSYDVEARAFNDHVVTLQRDLHRWNADFSFRQTATGNWSFMFEVSLRDNRDLHFDYEQRSRLSG